MSGRWAFARAVPSVRSALSSPRCFQTPVSCQLLCEPPSRRVARHPLGIQSFVHTRPRGHCPCGVRVSLPPDSPAAAHPQGVSTHSTRRPLPAPAPLLPYQREAGCLSASLMLPMGEVSMKCWGLQVRAQHKGEGQRAPPRPPTPAPAPLLAPPPLLISTAFYSWPGQSD